MPVSVSKDCYPSDERKAQRAICREFCPIWKETAALKGRETASRDRFPEASMRKRNCLPSLEKNGKTKVKKRGKQPKVKTACEKSAPGCFQWCLCFVCFGGKNCVCCHKKSPFFVAEIQVSIMTQCNRKKTGCVRNGKIVRKV